MGSRACLLTQEPGGWLRVEFSYSLEAVEG
jgi:hypothetical protein